MKRWIPAVAIVIVLVIALCLFMPVNRYGDFEGEWYSAGKGELYVFQDGIIDCQTHFYLGADQDNISGAYVFASEKLAILVRGIDDLTNVEELYLVQSESGEVLNESEDGAGITYFYRDQAAAVSCGD